MKFNELKVGMRVFDKWFLNWGQAKVVRILKNRVYLSFGSNELVYDKPHVQFLEKDK